MFSYRHAFHVGNHADVLKHAILVAILRHLALKDKSFWVFDTHAGAGRYRLDAAQTRKNAEYRSGIEALWQARKLPALLADYRDEVARFDAEQRAMITGEEKYLPARDKGRARRFVRDYVDARHSFSEWILAVMMVSIILIMVLSMLGNKIPLQYQAYMLYGSSILMYGSFIITAVESLLVWRKVKRTFAEAHPRDNIPSGTGYYTFSRMIMPRRWRSPRPQVDRGQFPK